MKYQCSGCGEVADTHVYAFTDYTYCIGKAVEDDSVEYQAPAPEWVHGGSALLEPEPLGCLHCMRMDVTFSIFAPLAPEKQAQGGSE